MIRNACEDDRMGKNNKNRMFRPKSESGSRRGFAPLQPRFTDYGWAYWTSAKALVAASSSGSFAAAPFPLVFLYRHAIELFLKGILIESGWNWGIQRQKVINRNHNLKDQLSDVEAVAREAGLEISGALKDYVGQLNSLDPKEVVFRFPEDKRGKRALTRKQSSFDVDQFVIAAESVLEELEALADDLDREAYRAILRREGLPG